ncbi:TetR/AcrR family transcriptional regulator [Sphingomonas adhaesiva]|uniref:TetR/AcrR family transcriptional regulator n=1 Tax=Sphingomonas adhaesiva TaxID=28212 RepID=UPI002FF7BD5F
MGNKLNTVKMSTDGSAHNAERTYHHGELRAALIAATDAILRERGIEGFSLREAARRAGVSPAAPAHHFGKASGLLTEVALLGYADLRSYLQRADPNGSPAARLRSLAREYVLFALDHPGRFRLMFRKDLIHRDDPRYREASHTALTCFADAAAAHAGTTREAMFARQAFGPVLAVWSTAHGIAHLALEDKFAALVHGPDPRRDFTDRLLPDLLLAQWPEGQSLP